MNESNKWIGWEGEGRKKKVMREGRMEGRREERWKGRRKGSREERKEGKRREEG